MKVLGSVRTYLHLSRELRRYWERSFLLTIFKMSYSRVFYQRGPHEFNEYRFTTKPLEEWRKYLDERERRSLQERAAPEKYRFIEENKILFWRRCMEAGLPTIPITAVVFGQCSVPESDGVATATSPEELREILEPLGDFEGFAKPLGGGQGYGAFAFKIHERRVSASEVNGSIEDLASHCMESRFGRSGYILQPRIRAHPGLSKVMTGPGLGTVRLTTFLDRDDQVAVPWAILKIPGAGQVVCNPRLGALMVPVDVQIGRLSSAVGPSQETAVVHEIERHPVSGIEFAGAYLPMWDEVIHLVKRAARAFRELPCLGWDVAISKHGPVLIETNWAFGIYTQQIALNRGLKSEFREFYRRCSRPSHD